MSDQTYSSHVFTADYDPAGFIKGIDATIAAAQKLNDKVEQLSAAVQEQRKVFDDNAVKIKEQKTQMEALEKAEGGITKESAALEEQIKKLTQTNEGLSKSIATQATELNKVKAQHEALQKTYEAARQKAKEFSDQAGKPIGLNVNDGDIVNKLQSLKTNFSQVFSGLTLDDGFNEAVTKAVTSARGEFEQISKTVDILKEKLVTLDPGTKEFTEVAAAIRAGDQVLNEYTKSFKDATKQVDQADGKFKSLRTRLRELRDELTRLEDAGQENTEQFRKTQIAAAHLQDQYGDMQQRIRILASDSKGLDFGVASLQAAATGYQVLLGAQALFSDGTEESARSQQKLLAVMNLVQGVQQLANLLSKDSIINTIGATAATQAYAATQRILAVSLGASATAARVLSVALITTGIGALVIGLGFLISKISEWTSKTEDAKKAQDALTDAIDRQNKSLTYEVDALDFAGKIREEKLKQQGAKRIEALRKQGASEATIQKAQTENEKQVFENTQQELLKKADTYNDRIVELNANAANADGASKKKINEQIFKLEDEKNKTLQTYDLNVEKERTKIAEDGSKKRKSVHDKENVYLKELARLNEELAKANLKDFTSDDTIQATFIASLNKQFKSIDDFLKKKELTKPQADKLKDLIKQIVDIDEKKALDDFHKKIEEIQAGIEKELSDMRFEESGKRIANIQNEFSRETAIIIDETKKQRAELREKQRDAFKSLDEDLEKGFINKTQYESYAAEIKDLYAKLLEDIKTDAAIKNAQLAERIFNDSLDEIERTFRITNLAISEGASQAINDVTQQYLKGKISYATYQKDITKIYNDAELERKQKHLKSIKEEIDDLDKRLTSTTLSPEAQKAEVERLAGLREQYQALNDEINGEKAEKKKTASDKRIATFRTYLTAVSDFVSAIGQAWQASNEAEQRSIERSIALQDRRVEAATRVAERGNATYLKLEEDKQQELLIKQENAARRQIAINAAVQASQILVAIASAAAQIAVGGPGATIIGIATIVGALASGYALVKSLQQNQPTFYEGSEYVSGRRDATKNIGRLERKGEPSGRDTIPAWLHEGEAVTDASTNAKYHPTIKAIHDGAIPPEVINGVVNAYPKWSMPQHNIKRMEAAAQVHVIHDARVADLLQQNIRETKRLNKTMQAIGINATLDAKGFSLAVNGFIAEHNLNKKA